MRCSAVFSFGPRVKDPRSPIGSSDSHELTSMLAPGPDAPLHEAKHPKVSDARDWHHSPKIAIPATSYVRTMTPVPSKVCTVFRTNR